MQAVNATNIDMVLFVTHYGSRLDNLLFKQLYDLLSPRKFTLIVSGCYIHGWTSDEISVNKYFKQVVDLCDGRVCEVNFTFDRQYDLKCEKRMSANVAQRKEQMQSFFNNIN